MDFVTDVLENNRRFRAFNIIDDFNREARKHPVNHIFFNRHFKRIFGA
jgi:hypothetical protein